MSGAQKSVIVIGSGIGGSAIGAMLSHRGYRVTVLEKLNFIGGRCCTWEREGFSIYGSPGQAAHHRRLASGDQGRLESMGDGRDEFGRKCFPRY